jgi:hypothetical protein
VILENVYKQAVERIKRLERLLGQKTEEVEILKTGACLSREKKLAQSLYRAGSYPMSRVCRALDVSRSNLHVRLKEENQEMPKKIEKEKDPMLLSFIRKITDERPTYGYRRVTALLKKKSQGNVNHKRVYRVMCQAGLL